MNKEFKKIDLNTWTRKQTFLGFKNFDFPYLVVGTEVDLTQALGYWKDKKLSPYLCLIYAVCRAANEVPAFRMRIHGNEVVEYEKVHANFTTPDGDDSFHIHLQEYTRDFKTFYASVQNREQLAKAIPGDTVHQDDYYIYMSCLPWVKFNHLVQPTTRLSGSIPRIAWGKFSEAGPKITMPISVQAHHSLIDGIHVARFFEVLEKLLQTPADFF